MTFVSRRKPLTRNRPAVRKSGHARFQVQLRGAAKREGSRRVRLRSLPERARPRFRAVAVVPWPSLPPRGASGQASAAGERPGAEPRSQHAWCRVPLPGGGDERREAWSCGLRSRWPCFRERCRDHKSCTNPRRSAPRSSSALASRSRAMPLPTGTTGQRSAFRAQRAIRTVGGPVPLRASRRLAMGVSPRFAGRCRSEDRRSFQ